MYAPSSPFSIVTKTREERAAENKTQTHAHPLDQGLSFMCVDWQSVYTSRDLKTPHSIHVHVRRITHTHRHTREEIQAHVLSHQSGEFKGIERSMHTLAHTRCAPICKAITNASSSPALAPLLSFFHPSLTRVRRRNEGRKHLARERDLTLKQPCYRDWPCSAICVQRFDDSRVLQFTLRIAVRCVLHRCTSQEIHR